jgi:hypothetical protein
MCGRFTASFEFRENRIRWNLQRDLSLFTPRYNIAPSQEVGLRAIRPVGTMHYLNAWGGERLATLRIHPRHHGRVINDTAHPWA